MVDTPIKRTREAPEEASVGTRMRRALNWVRFTKLFLYFMLISCSWSVLIMAIAGPVEGTSSYLTTVGIVFLIASFGIRYAERRPIPVPVLLALSYTTELVLWWLSPVTDGWGLASPIAAAFWAACFWLCAYQAWRLKQLAKENPDSYIARLMRNEGPEVATGSQARELKLHAEKQRKQSRRLNYWSATFIAMLAINVFRHTFGS